MHHDLQSIIAGMPLAPAVTSLGGGAAAASRRPVMFPLLLLFLCTVPGGDLGAEGDGNGAMS